MYSGWEGLLSQPSTWGILSFYNLNLTCRNIHLVLICILGRSMRLSVSSDFHCYFTFLLQIACIAVTTVKSWVGLLTFVLCCENVVYIGNVDPYMCIRFVSYKVRCLEVYSLFCHREVLSCVMAQFYRMLIFFSSVDPIIFPNSSGKFRLAHPF